MKKRCENCGKEYNKVVYFKGKYLCKHCLRKKGNLMPTTYFPEPLTVRFTITIVMTKTQDEFLRKRLKGSNKGSNKDTKRPGITPYIRNLILKDLYNYFNITSFYPEEEYLPSILTP